MKRICSVLLTVALLLSVITVAGMVSSAAETANEIQFRGFEAQKSDYNCNLGGVFVGNSAYGSNNTPAVGTGYMGGKAVEAQNQLHHYIYAYNQQKTYTTNGTNVDGCTTIRIDDPNEIYASMDFYVSDASVVNNPTSDCGFGFDATIGADDPSKDIGEFQGWGSTFGASKQVIVSLMKEVKTGWNHLLIPLKIKKNSYKEKVTGQIITITTMRLYITGINVPAGFVSAIDDVRVMNKQAALTTYVARTSAKTVTDLIRAYPASATYEDFYKVYLTYNATPDSYKSLIIGWDTFIANNTTYKAQADTALAADKAAATPVANAIEALNKTITKDDAQDIASARAAYDALSENQKVLVLYSGLLAEAESQVAAIITAENQAAAQPVVDAIAALPLAITAEHKDAVASARAAYDTLTEEQKAMVYNYTILTKAETTLEGFADQIAAKEVENLISALPDVVTQADKAAVEAVRTAYNALTEAQQALVPNLAKLEQAEAQLEEVEISSKPDEPSEPGIPGEYKLGDLDGDGLVNAKDALLILKYAVGKITKFPIEG